MKIVIVLFVLVCSLYSASAANSTAVNCSAIADDNSIQACYNCASAGCYQCSTGPCISTNTPSDCPQAPDGGVKLIGPASEAFQCYSCGTAQTCDECSSLSAGCAWCFGSSSCVPLDTDNRTASSGCSSTVLGAAGSCAAPCAALYSCSSCLAGDGCNWCNDGGGTCSASAQSSCSDDIPDGNSCPVVVGSAASTLEISFVIATISALASYII